MMRALGQELWTQMRGCRFWMAVSGVILLTWFLAGYYIMYFPGNDIISYLGLVNFDPPMLVAYSICAYAYACVYCVEQKGHVASYLILRTGVARYVFVRTLTGFFVAFAVFFIGKMLFVFTASSVVPVLIPDGSTVREYGAEGWGLRELLLEGQGVFYLVWMTMVDGLKVAVLCMIAQTFSLFVKHSVLVIGIPMLLNYLIYNYLDSFLGVPSWLSWLRVYDASNPYFSDGVQFLYTMLYTLLVVLLMGIISYGKVKRELHG